MDKKKLKRLERIIEIICIIIAGILIAHSCSGCVRIPIALEDGTRVLHESNLIICQDYIRFVLANYKGEELRVKLEFIRNHLMLSKALDDFVKGQGDHIQFLLLKELENDK